MDYTKELLLDVNAVDNFKFVQAKQGDKILRKIAISLLKDGQPFTPQDVFKSEFRCEKPDGNAVIISSTDAGTPITVSGGTYTVSLPEQALIVAGRAMCDFALYDSSNNVLSASTFVLDIIPMPDIGRITESSTEWTRLIQAIETAEHLHEVLAFRYSNGYLQYTTNGTTWTNIVQGSQLVEQITNQQIDALFMN